VIKMKEKGEELEKKLTESCCGNPKLLLFDHDGTLVDTNLFYCSKKPSREMLNPETVGLIQGTGYPYGIVAGTKKEHVDKTIELLPRKPLFTVCFEDYYPKTKPDPAPYLLALTKVKLQGIGQEEVIVFEDSDVGEESARQAGFSVIRVRSYCKL